MNELFIKYSNMPILQAFQMVFFFFFLDKKETKNQVKNIALGFIAYALLAIFDFPRFFAFYIIQHYSFYSTDCFVPRNDVMIVMTLQNSFQYFGIVAGVVGEGGDDDAFFKFFCQLQGTQ